MWVCQVVLRCASSRPTWAFTCCCARARGVCAGAAMSTSNPLPINSIPNFGLPQLWLCQNNSEESPQSSGREAAALSTNHFIPQRPYCIKEQRKYYLYVTGEKTLRSLRFFQHLTCTDFHSSQALTLLQWATRQWLTQRQTESLQRGGKDNFTLLALTEALLAPWAQWHSPLLPSSSIISLCLPGTICCWNWVLLSLLFDGHPCGTVDSSSF